MTEESPSFLLFPNLPPELRTRIWQHALPDIGPAICQHRKGLWHPRYLQPGDEGYNPRLEDNIDLEFRPDLVIEIPVELPLILVNSEARRVALEWAGEYDIKMPPQGDDYTCMRPFDPERDIIYVKTNQIEDFYNAPWERMFQDDLANRMITSTVRPKNLAMSEKAIRKGEVKPLFLSMYNSAAHLFVIVGEQPDFEGLWEVDSSRGRSMFWNWKKLSFDMGDGAYITDEGFYRAFEENKKEIVEDLPDFVDLEIRPAFAVRR
ncbi:hypothetical protein CEP54_010844 [Fusarium duplospermum]|uniref:2EXR domain-containing protein n=1 Tax=Fusarium duplospermum TaxID=1325734 RepID=A0A428PHQ3_9HYPO|nr:hypothetical protein CEP54_010844 [Fusarium duplospermum]